MSENAASRWHPIAAAHDVPYRHVFHGQLLGREFAVWRADDGFVNVWENRCLHRGVRLSIGINDGRELKCQYHGWRYSNRSAGCTYIPAHPADAPARTITIRTYPVAERYGFIWSCLDPVTEMPDIAALDQKDLVLLRGISVNAPADWVIERLKTYQFWPTNALGEAAAETVVEGSDEFCVTLRSSRNGAQTRAVLLVQPVDAGRSVIRGALDAAPAGKERIAVLRHHNERLSALRDEVERQAAAQPAPIPIEPVYQPVTPELAAMPERVPPGRNAALRVVVARKWRAGEGVAGFELRAVDGYLPTFQPGAHIDVHLPNGQVRQYSIVNAPGETASYVIGVKREPDSKGGSQCLHEAVQEGDVLAISEPRNNFPLRRNATRTIFIAGGIGITPLLAMALALHHSRLAYELHYFSRSRDHFAFPERLGVLGDNLKPHVNLSPQTTEARIRELLAVRRPRMQVYVCGPGPMLDVARRIAAEHGWSDSEVRFEYFRNTRKLDDSTGFEVALSRSCITLAVSPGQSILAALRERGIAIPSSCEQGACGTCIATVLEGEPDHQDVYLNDAEKRGGSRIITCVSRAKSARLILDL